jgi:ATP-dependent 26S proteasome regulatory subunit
MLNRIMVGLPTLESRALILRKLLSKEKVDENIDFKELATMTACYSGSDLKVSKQIRMYSLRPQIFVAFDFFTSNLTIFYKK